MTALAAETERPVTVAPVRSGRLRHLPALDGLRGLAVVAVLLFHGGFHWAKGGWLGVSVFFTLSGFLITNLLVAEWREEGTISLRTFWSRRFRRLMPAALTCLLLVALYGAIWASPEQLRNLRVDLFAALAYAANWRFLVGKLSYADLFSAPSPVQHFWSLAIEEQFYVVYPLVAFAALRVGGRRLLASLLGLAVAGSLVVAYVERSHLDRVYYGTDTRMAELLAGGLLALWWARSSTAKDPARSRSRRAGVVLLGSLGLGGSLLLWPSVGQADRFVTHGALPLQALLSVAMIAAAARPGLVSRCLSIRPLRALGLVSYGLYLYHWPIFLVLDHDRTHLGTLPLFVVRMAVTSVATVLSYRLIEQPIRRKVVLRRRLTVGPAVLGGVAAVVLAALVVTWAPPASKIAHAGVKLEDQVVTVDTVAPKPTVPAAAATGVAAPPAIMIVGDSGTYDAAPAIGAQFEYLGTSAVVDTTFPGFGLTRDPLGWHRDWPDLVRQHRPQLSIVMLGGWDEQYVRDKGEDAYLKVIDDAVHVLTAAGGKILWLGMLPGPNTPTKTMDTIFRKLPARYPGTVQYGNIGDAVVGTDGSYPRWIPGDDGALVLARKPDGWHLCPDGAARVGRAVDRIASGFGLAPPPRTGWEQGDWRTSARYDDPKGGCDVSARDNAPPAGAARVGSGRP